VDDLFAAQWSRGLETLDLTIRAGTSETASMWDTTNPFGYACGSTHRVATTVSGREASYSLGAYGGGRLWWRDGTTLYTLTAPLPRGELVRIAESLQPVTPS
jgi:hypothetical protein